MKTLLFTACIILPFFLAAQDMQNGFNLLETGAYKEAKLYFEEVLQDYPQNKTARLCYGRALGLSGDTTEATELFTQLQTEYPEDFEVALNYAESLLWDRDYIQAKEVYQNLLIRDSTSFSAVLGYANTLSNLKEYDLALKQVTQALKIQPGNANALVSRKYIRLGLANQWNTEGKANAAIALLEKNLNDFNAEALSLEVMANVYISQKEYDAAFNTYGRLADSTAALTGKALVAHLQESDTHALDLAHQALQVLTQDSVQKLQAEERYIQALIWNRQFKLARKNLDSLSMYYGNISRILALKASLGMYTGTFKRSIQHYEAILAKDSSSFDGNLGIANAYRAMGDLDKAYAFALQTTTYYDGQKDAEQLKSTISASLAPQLTPQFAYTRDNGGNRALAAGFQMLLPVSYRLRSVIGYNYRKTKNALSNAIASNTTMNLGIHYRIKANTWIESNLGILKAEADTNTYTDVNGSLILKTRPLPLQHLELGYRRELQNFNAELIDQKIFMNNYSLNYNMGTNIDLGWYTSLIYTPQTDGNTRNLLFTSLYYTFTNKPALKGGVNYQYLGFKNQVPTLYFSPSSYQAIECFADLRGAIHTWQYAANAAGGLQFIENQKASTLYRLEVSLKHSLSQRFDAGIYGKYSNVASATAAGFEFTELGINLRWQVLAKPVFKL